MLVRSIEMKLDCCVFLWKLSFLKTREITTPLKSGPYGAQPLIFNSIKLWGSSRANQSRIKDFGLRFSVRTYRKRKKKKKRRIAKGYLSTI
jgi:hypothetical protein